MYVCRAWGDKHLIEYFKNDFNQDRMQQQQYNNI